MTTATIYVTKANVCKILPGLNTMVFCVQVSYMILQRVSPVTHSIGNCLKRVIVIVASVLFFKNPVSQQNVVGELCLSLSNS